MMCNGIEAILAQIMLRARAIVGTAIASSRVAVIGVSKNPERLLIVLSGARLAAMSK